MFLIQNARHAQIALLQALFLVSTFAAGLGLPGKALAHRILMQEEGPGELRVYYEGGQPASEVMVTILDEQGKAFLEGRTDSKGVFAFEPHPDAVTARADDGMGHRVVYDLVHSRVEGGFRLLDDDTPIILRVVAGVGMIFLIFTGLYAWRKSRAHS